MPLACFLTPIRPPALVEWLKEVSGLIPRTAKDDKHALVIVGHEASKAFSPNRFLPSNLNLETATVHAGNRNDTKAD
jgi:hypothetical protein